MDYKKSLMSVKQIVTPMKYREQQKYVINSAAIHKYLLRNSRAINIEWSANPKKKTGEKAHLYDKKKGTSTKSSLWTSIFGRSNLQLKVVIMGITNNQLTKIM
jgi:hypothetical protein